MRGRYPERLKRTKHMEERKINIQVRRSTHKKLKQLKESKRLADFDAVVCYLLELYEQVIEGK